ncbi:hypothetical protein [Mesorhizobium sp. 113-1-2]|uniref:hypothetical protein n=1 Tax=Mesorhizobium sp. 113-1-2 TaxID=2744515 RepID=UPI001929077F|nr:hypothetical protein [Mesorhizobium sp. 113-1-2]
MRKTKPVVGDQRQSALHKVDVEIERLEKVIGEKVAAVDADRKKHALDQDGDLQKRLEAEIRVLRGRVDALQQRRFAVEIADNPADPNGKPAALAAAGKAHRPWKLEPVQEPEYPGILRTPENQKTFADAFGRVVAWAVYRKHLGFKEAGCHPDQSVDLELVSMIAAQTDAGYYWLSQRVEALETRVSELEARSTVTTGAKAPPITRAVTRVTKFDGQGRIAEFEKVEGEAEQIDLLARVEALEARPQLEYQGTWKPDRQYKQGALTTHDGSMWHAEIGSKGVTPGHGEGCWRLCVKKGRDARS